MVDPATQDNYYGYSYAPEYPPEEYYLNDQSSITQVTDLSESKPAGDSESARVWVFVCVFLVICLIFGVVIVLLVAVKHEDTDTTEDVDGSSGPAAITIPLYRYWNHTHPTVPRRPIIPTPRTVPPLRTVLTPRRVPTSGRIPTPRTAPTSAAPPATMTLPRRTPSSATPPTTTTQPPPLLCSVGSPAAAIHPLYPPDRSCDIVFFTHVRVKNNTVRPVLSKISFPTFRNVCAAYRDTTCGLSFDVNFLDGNQFSATDLLDHLGELRSTSRINHYGVLNIYGAPEFVESISGAGHLTDTISAFRSALGDDRKKHMIVVGVGYFFYNGTNSWQNLTQVVERVAAYDVDVVVVITTLLTQPDRRQCLTLPVNAIDSLNPFVPTMEAASHMITAGFSRPSLVVAFALQMGVVYYSLDKEYDLPISALYQACSGFGLADYSQACQADTSELTYEKVVIGLTDDQTVQVFNGTKIFQTHDTLDLMELKASQIMAKPDTRANFTWFLFNVHLTDTTNICLADGPFARVKGFRDFFYREAQNLRG